MAQESEIRQSEAPQNSRPESHSVSRAPQILQGTFLEFLLQQAIRFGEAPPACGALMSRESKAQAAVPTQAEERYRILSA